MSDGEFSQEEEKKPFWKTPIGIILIIVGVLLLCCCITGIVLWVSGAAVIEEILNNPEFQQEFEDVMGEVQATLDAQMTIEAGE